MDDDKDKDDVLPGGSAGKRTPPTIDLAASKVTDTLVASDVPDAHDATEARSEPTSEPAPESSAASSPNTSRTLSVLVSAFGGVVAALLVIGAATFAGWPEKPAPVSTAPLADNIASNKAEIASLGARVAKVESDAAKLAPRPAADPALIARLDAAEKSLASLRNDIAAVRGQSEKVAAALGEIKSASPQGVVTAEPQASAIDLSALEERLGRIERTAAALTAAASTPPQPPAEDPNVRKMAAATQLDAAVRQGEPYASALAAARSVGGDADSLKALDAFAATGVPTANALCRELLALLPQLAPKPAVQAAPSGILERLQQSAAKLVRIQRVDTPAGTGGALARITAAAQRDDLKEAKRELLQLTASDREPVQAWIAKADARDAALATSRQFASDTMSALSKPAR